MHSSFLWGGEPVDDRVNVTVWLDRERMLQVRHLIGGAAVGIGSTQRGENVDESWETNTIEVTLWNSENLG